MERVLIALDELLLAYERGVPSIDQKMVGRVLSARKDIVESLKARKPKFLSPTKACLARAAVILLVASTPSFAWVKNDNPDRYPSIGVELAKGQVAGTPRKGVDGDVTNGGTVGFLGDFRFPATQNLTLHASLQTDGINNNLAYTEGYRLAVGLRVYIKD
jgi:hypothetical protein